VGKAVSTGECVMFALTAVLILSYVTIKKHTTLFTSSGSKVKINKFILIDYKRK